MSQTKHIWDDPRFSSLPNEYWTFAQITGKIIHSSAFTPITSRDSRRRIVNLDLLESLSKEYAALQGYPAGLEKWLSETRLNHEAWAKTADNLAGWLSDRAERRSLELHATRERRLEAVIRNLTAAGLEKDLESLDLDLLRHHELVRVPKDLTERVWIKIKPKIIDFILEVRSRLREEYRVDQITRRRRIFAQYVTECHSRHYAIPAPISELSQLEPFKSIIEDSPIDEVITLQSFPPPQAMYQIFTQWYKEKKQSLVQIMRRSSLQPRYLGTSQINLATTFFYCKGPGVREPIGQQDIIVHPAAFSWRAERDYSSTFLRRLFEDFRQEFWNFGGDRGPKVARQYQTLDRNIIAALSTGSGKTLISLLLIRWISALEASNGKAIIFLVPKVALVEQQGNFISRNTPLRVIKLHGALDIDLTDRARWKKRFSQHDVFVMTAQIFLNLLTHSVWSIDKVSLMIFDECHHARKNHPYNGIMREYFQVSDVTSRPRIFGMTASPIWNPKDPLGSLRSLEANLDSKVVGVRAHVEELDRHSPKPVEIIKEFSSPPAAGEYKAYPSPSLWDCLRVFDKSLWDELNVPWASIEMRYYATLSNLGPYAASLFLYDEVEQHVARVYDEHMQNLRTLEYTDDLDLPSGVKFGPPPPDFWQMREVHVDFRGLLAHPSPDQPISLEWFTPKVQVLVDILRAYCTADFQGIIFVEQRQTAICLAQILPAIAELSGLVRCGPLMGQGVNSDGIAKTTPSCHKNVVEAFRKGEINLLIATSVAEEGLDFPACDLVIRFDPVAHMVGYVQSRGRARNKSSTFVIMIQKNDIAHLSRYNALRTIEPEVKRVYQSRDNTNSHAGEDGGNEELNPIDLAGRERYVVDSSGAVLTYDNSIQLLHYLCSLIPRDAFTPPHVPTFSGDFQVSLTLPSSIPLPPENLIFTGPLRHSKREAKRAAAFMAVKRLHELNVYDDYLLPVARSKGTETEDADGRPLIDVAKVPVMMDVLVKNPWMAGPRLWTHLVFINNHAVASLITGTSLPAVDVRCGAASIHTLSGEPMPFNDEDDESDKRKLMLEFTRLGIWFCVTARPLASLPNLFLVPITPHLEPDFEAMKRLVANPRGSSDWSKVTANDFDNLMIMNTNLFGRPFLLRNVYHDLNPMSIPPLGSREYGADSYHQYFVNKWTRKKWEAYVPTEGPLIAAAILPRSSNGAYNIGPGGSIREVVHTVADGLVMPRDCCRWIPMSPDIRKAFEVLPTLCHRITDIYRVRCARYELGLPPIKDNLLVEALTLPSADAGYSNQRMETLGDAVLELCTTVHLFHKYPYRHEGQLSILRAGSISNRYLLGRAKDVGLERFITSEGQSLHTWRYVESLERWLDPFARPSALRRYPRRSLQDCMEALLGASFITGGIPMALQTGTALGLSFGGTLPWPLRYGLRSPLASPAPTLLDLVVIRYLYNKYPQATSAQMALPKAKAVCSPALASLAVRRLGLHKIILVNRFDLTEAINTYVPLLETSSSQEIVKRGWKYDPPKALSDAFEAVMGAVLIDSSYNLEKAMAVVEYVMEDILDALSPSMVLDPVSALLEWMAGEGCRKISIEKRIKVRGGIESEGMAVLVHDVVVAGPIISASLSVARFVAAERALTILKDVANQKSLLCLCKCKFGIEDDEPEDDLLEEMEVAAILRAG
ncbi:hypothetical protein H0H81_008396 [Sphagnurus paluster]|uniref:Dicer-like protein 1 n=1 Tax=Sphagnurus paluster TaxID=117069 RepID=A0A9P7GQX6_9AGAR|nr:hypothetical protein H0H81_008396 [Sphagnurus paluster]